MAIETPEYKVISKHEGFEVRCYSEMVIATTKVQADYKSSTYFWIQKNCKLYFWRQ